MPVPAATINRIRILLKRVSGVTIDSSDSGVDVVVIPVKIKAPTQKFSKKSSIQIAKPALQWVQKILQSPITKRVTERGVAKTVNKGAKNAYNFGQRLKGKSEVIFNTPQKIFTPKRLAITGVGFGAGTYLGNSALKAEKEQHRRKADNYQEGLQQLQSYLNQVELSDYEV